MDELDINELNNYVSGIDFYKIAGIYLPSEKQQEIKSPVNMCSLDERQEVRRIFFSNAVPDISSINSDSYIISCICSFMIDKKIPVQEKEVVCKYLDENIKMKIFEAFIMSEFKPKFKPEYDVLDGGIYYSPKRNGVPLKQYRRDNNKLKSTKLDASFDDVSKLLMNRPVSNQSVNMMLAAVHLINESGVLNELWCPQYVKEFMNKYKTPWDNYEDKLCEENDKLLKDDLEQLDDVDHKVRVNENLKKSILDSIPSDFNTLEKAIYIYSKLCQILSYDPMYFVGKKKQYDKSISKVENIDLEDNHVVCYNFSYILADLLMEIGVTKIKEHKLDGDKFDDEHSNISFLIDGLVIFADSTRSVIEGDLTTLKYSSNMSGIRCEQYDENSQKAFKEAKAKVASHINKENMQYNSMLPDKEQVENLSINDRVIMFNNYLTSCTLTNTNFISYMNKLASILQINVNPKIFYNDETNDLFVQVNLGSYYGDILVSYVIDTTTKKTYQKPKELSELKGQ